MKMWVYNKEKGLRRLKRYTTIEEYQKIYPDAIKVYLPHLRELDDWFVRGICGCPDGCMVEPDGVCPHGCQSWLRVLGYI